MGCPAPQLKMTATLMVADPCDPPMLEDGTLVIPGTQTFWPGQCVSLQATTGTDPATYINGSGYYQITICNAETGQVVFGPANVDISADHPADECINIANLLVTC